MPEGYVIQFLEMNDIETIVEKVKFRQKTYTEEGLGVSIGVVLMNYGDRYVKVRCINGEWDGTKETTTPRKGKDGVPLCPNGHPLLEISEAPRFALVDKVQTNV